VKQPLTIVPEAVVDQFGGHGLAPPDEAEEEHPGIRPPMFSPNKLGPLAGTSKR
jgi:hypothetical protein